MGNRIDLEGCTAVVTGGAQGFGRAITERFAASGARVAIWDRDMALAERTAAELGERVTAIVCDVTDPAKVAKARDATVSRLGRIDILVNNAGIAGTNAKTWETDVEEWRKVMRINLDGPFICSRAVAPLMVKRGGGSILTMTYLGSQRVFTNYNVMGVAKAALESTVRYLAADLGPQNIRVNALSAGPIKTLAAAGISGFSSILQVYRERAPLRRNVDLAEVADAALFLLSPASRAVTGEIVMADAGFHVSGGA